MRVRAGCSRSSARTWACTGRSAAAGALPLKAALLHLDTDFELHQLSHGPRPRRCSGLGPRRRDDWSSSNPAVRLVATASAAEAAEAALAHRRGVGKQAT